MEISLTEFARLTGESERGLYKLRERAELPPPDYPRGGYDLWRLLTAYIQLLQAQSDRKADPCLKDRLDEARAVKIELQNVEAMGELVKASEVATVWQLATRVIRQKLESVSYALGGELEGITDPVIRKEILDAAIYDALEELGDTLADQVGALRDGNC